MVFDKIQRGLSKVRNIVGKVFPVAKNDNPEQGETVETVTEDQLEKLEVQTGGRGSAERQARRERIRKRRNRYRLNRKSRRFLQRVLGETYPAGSLVSKTMFDRINSLQQLPYSIERKRYIAKAFLTAQTEGTPVHE